MMKRRAFGMLLSLCLVLALIPAAAFAAEPLYTLRVPYMTTVEKGGSEEPGETVFQLMVMGSNGDELVFEGVVVDGDSILTNGKGSYSKDMTFAAPYGLLLDMFYEGAFVKQVDEGEDGWTYDNTVWCVFMDKEIAARASQEDAVLSNYVHIYPTKYEEDGDGGRHYMPDFGKGSEDKMTFKNTYTKTATEVTPDPDDASSDANVSALPKTGDSSNLTGWLILLAVSAAAVAGAVVYGRRRKNARE